MPKKTDPTCKEGHDMAVTGYRDTYGNTRCRECTNAWMRDYYARRMNDPEFARRRAEGAKRSRERAKEREAARRAQEAAGGAS